MACFSNNALPQGELASLHTLAATFPHIYSLIIYFRAASRRLLADVGQGKDALPEGWPSHLFLSLAV